MRANNFFYHLEEYEVITLLISCFNFERLVSGNEFDRLYIFVNLIK